MKQNFNCSKLLILGFQGLTPDRQFFSFIEKNPPAGFLLLGENFKDRRQLKLLIQALKEAAGEDIIAAVDQEPGRVQRFRTDFPISNNPDYYTQKGKRMEFEVWCSETAAALSECGVNLNLAPVLDLSVSENSNGVLKDRSFGDNPDIVSKYAAVLIREFQKLGIKTCGKHFPGLGSAVEDPHLRLAVSNSGLAEMRARHIKPYFSAIAERVECIMTTHLLCRAIDSEKPATYSSETIKMLRTDLNFEGVIISDDLFMAGAGINDDIPGSAERSIRSGHNLIIISRDFGVQQNMVEHLNKVCKNDEEFFTQIDNYTGKIENLFSHGV